MNNGKNCYHCSKYWGFANPSPEIEGLRNPRDKLTTPLTDLNMEYLYRYVAHDTVAIKKTRHLVNLPYKAGISN